ncbi:MAG: chloride channel protein [Oscillospiraceae bacterium]|jgi:H+/Cl- antiporter ClcA|nr:chloride channel protein [Oscillospiraceae bacterium]
MTRLKRPALIALITVFMGLVMGVIAAAFLALLDVVTKLRQEHLWLIALLPPIGAVTAVAYTKFGKESHKGSDLIIESVHQAKPVPLRMAALTFFFTLLTHLGGGSVGREGTAVQIGGALSNSIGRFFKADTKMNRVIVMTGVSAGFGAVFGTPLSGAFFGLEMCFIGKFSYEAILPCFTAAYLGDFVTRAFGIHHPVHSIVAVPEFGIFTLAVVIAGAAIFGLTGKIFAVAVHSVKHMYEKLIKQPVLRVVIGSALVAALMAVFHAYDYAGLANWMVDKGFAGQTSIIDPVMKFALTVLTLGGGLQGGEVTPMFDIGASLGGVIGRVTGVEVSLLAALGMICVFGSAANTPLTTIILGIELFGAAAAPYYVIAALIGYYISGHGGLYRAQVIALSKYHNETHIGKTLGELERGRKE